MLIPEFSWEMAEETFKKPKKVGRWLDELHKASGAGEGRWPTGGCGGGGQSMVSPRAGQTGSQHGSASYLHPKADREVQEQEAGAPETHGPGSPPRLQQVSDLEPTEEVARSLVCFVMIPSVFSPQGHGHFFG